MVKGKKLFTRTQFNAASEAVFDGLLSQVQEVEAEYPGSTAFIRLTLDEKGVRVVTIVVEKKECFSD